MTMMAWFHICVVLLAVCSTGLHAKPPVKIVGGQQTGIRRAPFMARIGFEDSILEPRKHLCSGVIIDTRHILTAAHCFRSMINDTSGRNSNQTFQKLRVVIGEGVYRPNPITYVVQDIYAYPNYTVDELIRHDHDIAVMRLKESIPLTPDQQPIAMATVDPPHGSTGVLFGWGKPSHDSAASSSSLKRLSNLMINSWDGCWKSFPNVLLPRGNLCVVTGNDAAPCDGDSGGPLVVDGILVAIMSMQSGCSEQLIVSSYVGVAYHINWIQGVLNNRGGSSLYSSGPLPSMMPLTPVTATTEEESGWWPWQWKLRSDSSRIEFAVNPYLLGRSE